MTNNQLESLQVYPEKFGLKVDLPIAVDEINVFNPWCPICKKEVTTTDGQCDTCFHMIGED